MSVKTWSCEWCGGNDYQLAMHTSCIAAAIRERDLLRSEIKGERAALTSISTQAPPTEDVVDRAAKVARNAWDGEDLGDWNEVARALASAGLLGGPPPQPRPCPEQRLGQHQWLAGKDADSDKFECLNCGAKGRIVEVLP